MWCTKLILAGSKKLLFPPYTECDENWNVEKKANILSYTKPYKVNNYYSPEHERGIAFEDKNLALNWRIPLNDIELSNKDKAQPSLSDAIELFE